MTEENLAAKRSNGRQSQGPATPEGKANSAAANLRHGFYSQARDEAMVALGEDPAEYAGLLESLVNDLQPREGLESQLVLRMGRALWRMQRAERMQDGLAMKRIQGKVQMEEFAALSQVARAADNLEPFEILDAALARRDGPTRAEIRTFVKSRGDNPGAEMKEFFALLHSLEKPAEEEPGPAAESLGTGAGKPNAKERKWKAARLKARAQLDRMMDSYRVICGRLSLQADKVRSSENLAALMAPQDENALLMQRLEDSNLRQLGRLTDTLIKVRNGALARKDVKNEGRPDYVHENKGEDDKMSVNCAEFLAENTQIER
jgi:hypothetical protein